MSHQDKSKFQILAVACSSQAFRESPERSHYEAIAAKIVEIDEVELERANEAEAMLYHVACFYCAHGQGRDRGVARMLMDAASFVLKGWPDGETAVEPGDSDELERPVNAYWWNRYFD